MRKLTTLAAMMAAVMMQAQNGDLGYGASWHPSYWQHEQMAGELIPYLRKLMGWY